MGFEEEGTYRVYGTIVTFISANAHVEHRAWIDVSTASSAQLIDCLGRRLKGNEEYGGQQQNIPKIGRHLD
jgi:hypothetical protein